MEAEGALLEGELWKLETLTFQKTWACLGRMHLVVEAGNSRSDGSSSNSQPHTSDLAP